MRQVDSRSSVLQTVNPPALDGPRSRDTTTLNPTIQTRGSNTGAQILGVKILVSKYWCQQIKNLAKFKPTNIAVPDRGNKAVAERSGLKTGGLGKIGLKSSRTARPRSCQQPPKNMRVKRNTEPEKSRPERQPVEGSCPRQLRVVDLRVPS